MSQLNGMFGENVKKLSEELHPRRVTKWIHYTKLRPNGEQYRDETKSREREEALADLIESDGQVLQDLLVRKTDADEYEIISGHTRYGACRILTEERKKDGFGFLPCIVQDISDVKARFELYSTNGYSQKTQYEIMTEIETMKHLIKTYPEEFPTLKGGRVVERLSERLGLAKSTVGEYLTVSKNLSDNAMELFKTGEIKKSAAVELAGMDAETQQECIDSGARELAQIKEFKDQKRAVMVDTGNSDETADTGQSDDFNGGRKEGLLNVGDIVYHEEYGLTGVIMRIYDGKATLMDSDGSLTPIAFPLDELLWLSGAQNELWALYRKIDKAECMVCRDGEIK